MKTKLLTLAVIAAIVFNIAQARAATCEGGKLATGKNGHEYCYSNNEMNWWSAYTWCEAQGRHLASMYELCPDTGEGLNNEWDGRTGVQCANLISTLNVHVWSSAALNTELAFYRYKDNSISSDERSRGKVAICY